MFALTIAAICIMSTVSETVRFLSICFYYTIFEAYVIKALLEKGRCMSSNDKA